MTEFAKSLTTERFDLLLEMSSWMQHWHGALDATHHCDENYLDLQQQGEEMREAIEASGFTWEQVETFAFDLAE